MNNILNQLQALELEAKDFGFYWETASQIMRQIISEYHEVQAHLDDPLLQTDSTLEEEIGDLLHATFSLCVFCHFHPEKTLQLAVDKFAKRFAIVKQLTLQDGFKSLHGLPFDTLMHFWNQAKELTQQTDSVESLFEIKEAAFTLDERLQNSCFTLIDWPLSRVLLKNHADYPWLILVPRKMHITEMTDLTDTEQKQLMCEINTASQVMQRIFQPDKINVGALGNVVSQFHFHIVGRYQHDPLWPQGIWQVANVEKKYAAPQSVIEQLKAALNVL